MQKTVHVFTSAALNYIPKVRILFSSIRRHHPDWKLHLLLADQLPDDFDLKSEPFDEITSVADLGIDAWKGWAFCHTITELATAIKPWMLAQLLDKCAVKDKVLYLDPDTVIFSPLTDILEALDDASIVLTPHQTSPESSLAAIIDNEICSLKHGIYNLGFIGVSNTPIGKAFARWWAERTYYFCRDDIPNGLFTDQRWIDLVPAFFEDVAIMRSTRHNVATWNITTRHLSKREDGEFLVDGEPLGFYHFTGFDSGAHGIMASKNGGNNPALHQLVDWYRDKIKPLGNDPLTHCSWHFGSFESGSSILPAQRIIYRLRRDLQIAFPDPFAAGGFENWWLSQAKREYPDLFSKHNNAASVEYSYSTLSPGFLGSSKQSPIALKAAQLLKEAALHPAKGILLSKRAWQILRQEGLSGIKARLY